MKDYVKPSIKYNPDLSIMHVGTNNVQSEKKPEQIADEIVKLAQNMKTEENEVTVSGLIPRTDDLTIKAYR